MSAFARDDAATPLLGPSAHSKKTPTAKWWILASASALLVFCAAVASQNMTLRTYLARAGWVPCTGCPLLAPSPGGTQGPVTFTLHSACKTPETKMRHADFFREGEKKAYIVHHNYGSPWFFPKSGALPMERVKLSDSEYGYRVTTNYVDFEWGFMLTKESGEEVREIGPMGEGLLAGSNCTQMYGPYFNRVMTLESIAEGDSAREYVFGTCGHECPPDYVDTAFAKYLGENEVVLPTCRAVRSGAASPYSFGEADDARDVSIISATLTPGGDTGKFGRMAAFKDTNYAASKQSARWLIAGVEGADMSMIKVATLDLTRGDDGRVTACVSSKKSIPFAGGRCRYIDCAPTKYDMARKTAEEGVGYTGALDVSAPLFMIPRAGDAVPTAHHVAFTNDAYLTEYTMHEAGTWGVDLDVRRIILTAAATCGGSSFSGNCVGTFTPFVDTTFANTKDEQRWVLVSYVGEADTVKMVRVKVFNDGGAVKIATISRAWKRHSKSGFDYDAYAAGFDAMDAFRNNDGGGPGADRKFSDGGYGVGTLRWLKAVEMVPSLARMGDAPLAIR